MTLETAKGTLALIALEDAAPDVLFETLPGALVPLWPTVRAGFMSAMQKHDFGSMPVESEPTKRTSAWVGLARAFAPSRWDARFLRSRRSTMFLMSGVTTYERGGRLRNWLVGDFAEQFAGDSVIVQWNAIGAQPPSFTPTRTLDFMETRSAGYARLRPNRVDTTRVRQLVREFATLLDARITEDQIDAIAVSASYAASLAPHLDTQFARVLDRVQPQVVLMEDASYGGRASLIALMKSRGVLVAEPQHGWIGPTHGAYNFGKAMESPELLATLPDELLTFGEYWSEGIRHPGVATAIGKAHLEQRAASVTPWEVRANEVLLVSNVANPEEMMDFGLALRAALPRDWSIHFRPHPSERLTVNTRYARLLKDEGIVVDRNSDVYASLASAKAVVGAASTVLFEAVAMGTKVFVKESPFSDFYTRDVFGSAVAGSRGAQSIAADLLEGGDTTLGRSLEAIWKSNSVSNFEWWLKSRLNRAA